MDGQEREHLLVNLTLPTIRPLTRRNMLTGP